jgi:hypothetical protein
MLWLIYQNPDVTVFGPAMTMEEINAFGWFPSPRRSFWPNLVQAISYGSIMILGLMGMRSSQMHWAEHSIFYGQFLSFALITAVFFGHTAYRAYLDVYLIVFAAGFMATLRVAALPKQIRLFRAPRKSLRFLDFARDLRRTTRLFLCAVNRHTSRRRSAASASLVLQLGADPRYAPAQARAPFRCLLMTHCSVYAGGELL